MFFDLRTIYGWIFLLNNVNVLSWIALNYHYLNLLCFYLAPILVIYFVYQIVGVVCNFLGSLSSQQNFAVTDQRNSHRLDQCYISVLQLSFIQKVKENTPLRCEGMPTQKTQREERPQTILALLFMFLLFPLGLPYENWASQDCCLFCLRSSFRSSDLPLFYFHGLFFSFLATAILDFFFLF